MHDWTHVDESLPAGCGTRHLISEGSNPLDFKRALELLATNASFREFLTRLLASSAFSAFRWETPALDLARASRPFEFVLINDPSLERKPDPDVFSSYFAGTGGNDFVTAVPNLSRTSILIVPRRITEPQAYTHLASFLRDAPREQVDAIWKRVAETMLGLLSDTPLWLSTAGAGAAWLHVRVDSVPKYYAHRPYAVATV